MFARLKLRAAKSFTDPGLPPSQQGIISKFRLHSEPRVPLVPFVGGRQFQFRKATRYASRFKPCEGSSLSTGQESRRSFHVETSCPLEQWWPVRRVISRDRSPRNSKGKGAHGLSLSLTR